jgi:hypothetical protein
MMTGPSVVVDRRRRVERAMMMTLSKTNVLKHIRGQLRHVSGDTFTKAG